MKRILAIFLILVFAMSFSSCGEKNAPEETAAKTFTATADDGVKIEVTVGEYLNKSKGLDFYVNSDAYIPVKVKVTNGSGADIYRLDNCYVHGTPAAQKIELRLDLGDGNGHKLTLSSQGLLYPDTVQLWSIAAGESYEWDLSLAAGEVSFSSSDAIDLDTDGHEGGVYGIKLYGEDIYTDGVCVFSGSVTFTYSHSDGGYMTVNDKSVSADVFIPVVFVK